MAGVAVAASAFALFLILAAAGALALDLAIAFLDFFLPAAVGLFLIFGNVVAVLDLFLLLAGFAFALHRAGAVVIFPHPFAPALMLELVDGLGLRVR